MIGSVDLGEIVWDASAMRHVFRSEHGDVGQYIAQICRDVEAEAKWLTDGIMVGWVTGQLNSSITHLVFEQGGEVNGLVGSNVEYALHVHEGTARMDGRPFMTTALENVLDEWYR